MDDLDDLLDCEQDLFEEIPSDQGPPHKRLKAVASAEDFDEDDELLALAQSQLPGSSSVPARAVASAAASGYPAAKQVNPTWPPRHSNTQEALDEAEEIAELVRLANSTVQPDPAAAQHGEQSEPMTDAADRTAEASTSYSRASAPSWSGADIAGESMSVTLKDGRRAFCRLHDSRQDILAHHRRNQHKTLLSAPISSLLQQVEQEAFATAVKASELQQAHDLSLLEDAALTEPPQQALWVDKYSPRSFFELLSDEQVNREVIKWVKSWDSCVHKKTASQAGAVTAQPQLGPEQRLLLLSGPPGLGKTTIAHVVARHCGYRPFEINASDDRTATALQSRIQDAVQMQSVLGKRQMNLVIVDEVDGIAGGTEGKSAVQVLLKLTQTSGGNTGGRQQEADQAGTDDKVNPFQIKKKAKKAAQPICRPIIAVCNDMYAPALRPLRGVAKMVQFKKPSVERLLQRLRFICEAEHLVIDRAALTRLCEQTECDVRSCLNTLQFLARKGRPIKVADLAGLSIGQKDISKGAFTIWQDLLQIKRSVTQSASVQQDRLLGTLQDFGDNSLVVSGLHENMGSMRFRDMHMKGTAAIAAQLCDADQFMTASHRRMDFSMQKYVPMCALAIRKIAAGPERVMLHWPKVHPQNVRRQTGQASLVQGWLEDLPSAMFCSVNPRIAVQEILPSLLQVVNQPLRPVAPHLFTPQEKTLLTRVVATLVAYALTFDLGQQQPHGLPDGAGASACGLTPLMPAVHTLCIFPKAEEASTSEGLTSSQKPIPMALCQIIAHEVKLENIRNRHQARPSSAVDAAAKSSAGASQEGVDAANRSASQAANATARLQYTVAQRMKEAGTGKVTKVKKGTWLDQTKAKQELGRKPLSAHQQRQLAHTAAGGGLLKLPTRYKFHEGYTNAVKRPILMQDLLKCQSK